MGNPFKQKKPPPPPAPTVMPDPDDELLKLSRKRSAAEQAQKSGRVSTILTDTLG